ncbi:MAG: TIR domain-containing protein, partial [Chitinophagaceae bacterium]
FNFEDWPFRFLLDILQLPKVKSSASPQLREYNIALMTQEFYQERFGLQFVSSIPEEFASELITEYRKDLPVHKNAYISYHDSDLEFVQAFKDNLSLSKLYRRFRFWDKEFIDPGDLKNEETEMNRSKATIYIPFISNRFLIDSALKQEMREMLKKPDVLVFPVIVKNCQFQSAFPDLKRKASLILPGTDDVLKSSTKEPEDADYIAILKKINSKIR